MYKIGDKVYHISKDKYGIVIECDNKGSNSFYNGFEQCYYVQHSGYIWSIPESFLRRRHTLKLGVNALNKNK